MVHKEIQKLDNKTLINLTKKLSNPFWDEDDPIRDIARKVYKEDNALTISHLAYHFAIELANRIENKKI